MQYKKERLCRKAQTRIAMQAVVRRLVSIENRKTPMRHDVRLRLLFLYVNIEYDPLFPRFGASYAPLTE
jgi:hypothetical protein